MREAKPRRVGTRWMIRLTDEYGKRRKRFFDAYADALKAQVTCPPIAGPGREFVCSTMDVLRGAQMARRKNYTPEEIVTKLRQVEVATAKGQAVALACKAAGITEQTYYRWRREYGGSGVDQAKRLKTLEAENTRLKRVVADQALDIAILKESTQGKF